MSGRDAARRPQTRPPVNTTGRQPRFARLPAFVLFRYRPRPANGRIDRTKPNRGAQWAPRLIGFAAHPDVGWRIQSGLVDAQANTPRPSNVFQPSSRACRRVSEGANAPIPTPRLVLLAFTLLWPKGPTPRFLVQLI